MKKLLIICGPTATGKTSLALSLAKRFGGELISADSRQVFKGLDALTGKERSNDIPIWLYDIVDPGDEFSVAHFVRLAGRAISDIDKCGKLSIAVGGTGFYLRALTKPVDTIAIAPDWALRERLETRSVGELQKIVEPNRLARMNDSDRRNPRRLIRAIEVAQSSPSSVRGGRGELQDHAFYDTLWIGLTAPLPNLKHRIETRIKSRFNQAAREVRDDLPPILGVDPLRAWSRGEMIKDEALRAWVNAEYQYAKRQLTWFRCVDDIRWFDVTEHNFKKQVFDMAESWYT